jgi:hypothetical protein
MERTVARFFVLWALAVSACAQPAAQSRCDEEPGARMTVYELFFGRNVKDHAPVSDADWDAFVKEVIGVKFPDGFTVLDGYGQWRNPTTGEIVYDPTKVLLVAAPPGPSTRHAIDAVRKAYEAQFKQQSVGVIAHTGCADFND